MNSIVVIGTKCYRNIGTDSCVPAGGQQTPGFQHKRTRTGSPFCSHRMNWWTRCLLPSLLSPLCPDHRSIVGNILERPADQGRGQRPAVWIYPVQSEQHFNIIIRILYIVGASQFILTYSLFKRFLLSNLSPASLFIEISPALQRLPGANRIYTICGQLRNIQPRMYCSVLHHCTMMKSLPYRTLHRIIWKAFELEHTEKEIIPITVAGS